LTGDETTSIWAHDPSSDTREWVETELHPMLIDGSFVDSSSGRHIAATSPSDGRALGSVPLADGSDVDTAVSAARSARDGRWGSMMPAEREKLLRRVTDLIEQHSDQLAEIESIDNGKPIGHTKPIDGPVATRLAANFSGWPTKISGDTPAVSIPGHFVYTLRRPVGVVGAIIPWNYPLIHTAQKIMPALACGNTIVLKPSEKASLVSLRMAEMFAAADLPPGVVNIISGDGPTTGSALTCHPGVDKVAFTGSAASGRAVMRAAADTTKRLSLELGNKGANIIFSDADLDAAVARSFVAAFGNTGQSCVAGSRLFVHSSVHDEVLDRLTALAADARIGHALDPATVLGPIVDDIQLDRIGGYIDRAIADGATLHHGGGRLTEGDLARGNFIEPTIFTDVDDSSTVACEEIFGPVVTVHRFDTEEEVVERANKTPFGLASALWTGSLDRAHRMAARLETGVVWINTFDMFDPTVPFGGMKGSGFGRDNGREVIDMYTESRAVWVSTR